MEGNTCAGCKTEIKSKSFMNCHGCSQRYDLECANLSPKRYKALNQENKRKWRCEECKSKQPKADNTNTPVRLQLKPNVDSEQDFSSDGSNVTSRRRPVAKSIYITEEKFLDVLKTERQAIKASIESSSNWLSDQLKTIKETCTGFEGFQESLSYVSKQYEDLRKDILDLKKILGQSAAEVKSLREENKVLKNNLLACETRVKFLEDENLKQQQWVRLQNLEIVGIPENKEEITTDLVMMISESVGAGILSSEIEYAHRVQPRRAASAAHGRPIVVHLKQRATKDRLLAAARKQRNLTTKDLGIGGGINKIFINEHLTKDNKMLLNLCKQKAKEVNYRYVWTKNCRIYTRKNDTSPPIHIASAADVSKIV